MSNAENVCYVVRRDNGTNDDNPHHAEMTVAVYADYMKAVRSLLALGCEPAENGEAGPVFWKREFLYWIEECPYYA